MPKYRPRFWFVFFIIVKIEQFYWKLKINHFLSDVCLVNRITTVLTVQTVGSERHFIDHFALRDSFLRWGTFLLIFCSRLVVCELITLLAQSNYWAIIKITPKNLNQEWSSVFFFIESYMNEVSFLLMW